MFETTEAKIVTPPTPTWAKLTPATDWVASGFSVEVQKLFEKHSGKLVALGDELDKRDALRLASHIIKN